ncbi:MAG: type III-B CRISPR-associated protein Cas10/Cmr2 [Verrucomicrobia bacterium]|nr:MAG: type III-B CRISPR-associated protein Cas10/Cmr2 [Verrucomicrobiota bacterium]
MIAMHLLKFQIGPVQDFIAQARSTRDLWSGSYLLSWLVAAGIRSLPALRSTLIFPNLHDQPLLEIDKSPLPADHTKLLTPNLPNVFIAKIEGDPTEIATAVKKAIEAEWQKIAEAVWNKRDVIHLPISCRDRYFSQVARQVSISWQSTPLESNYASTYKRNGQQLDAVRQTREFCAWDSCIDIAQHHNLSEKDSLSGKEEALVGGTNFIVQHENNNNDYCALFTKHADYLGAVSIIKRCWHLAYLKDVKKFKTSSKEFTIRSIPAIAAREKTHDDDEKKETTSGAERYIAAIAFDGDQIGKWVSGDFLPENADLEKHHASFSAALSDFAMNRVRSIVEPLGQLIYAGGDDVLALAPADRALDIAEKLRIAFCDATKHIIGKDADHPQPDASVGIAIAHIHSPLQDLIKEAQKAEKRAKNEVGRPAFSITLMKRSGEISYWGSKWSSGGLQLYQAIAKHLVEKKLSGKFPHRVTQLLTPYLTERSKISHQTNALNFPTFEIITREFAFAASQQGSVAIAKDLAPVLENYLKKLSGDPQKLLTSLIDLCTTVAFTHRTLPAVEKQSPVPA